jgi:hypothetical protein
MLQNSFKALVAVLVLTAVMTAHAATKSLVKRSNFFESQPTSGNPTSPWFNLDVSGGALFSSADTNTGDHTQGHSVISKPSGTGVQAGQVSSVTVASNYTITGWANAPDFNDEFGIVGGDENGIPAGITITFKTAVTFSVDAGNFLTLAASPNAGNGLGITNTQGASSTLDVGETLHVSDVTVTDVAFSGSVPGYTFSNLTITNLGTQVLRSGAGSDFAEATESAGLYSVPPDVSGNPKIGFGLATGVSQSGIKIDNGFDAAGTNFNRHLGAWDFKVLAGSMSLRGVGFQYDLGYDIVANVPGDYNHNGVADAADYILWRKGDPAADGNSDTVVDQSDYELWRANFGNPNPPGAGSGGLAGSAVPEPASVVMLIVGLLGSCIRRRGGRSQL